MTNAAESLVAHEQLPGTMTACSWRAGWRSVLLRGYDDPPSVEEFTTLYRKEIEKWKDIVRKADIAPID